MAAGAEDRVTSDIDKINHAADTMGNLLNDLLELSRVGRVMGEPRACNLSEIAHKALDLVRSEVDRKQIEVVIDDMPEVWGDETRLVEVYLNLIENAVKFMGRQDAPRVQIGARRQGNEVLCYVRDNGVGIKQEYQSQIFGLFERLDADVEGTGVGLALVKRIIEVHGGKIWIESEGEGRGTSIVFTLPESVGSKQQGTAQAVPLRSIA